MTKAVMTSSRPTGREIITRDAMRLLRARRELSAFIIAIVVGVLHREAKTTPWADDRLMAADPAWLQFGAPKWHAVFDGAFSPSTALTRLLDPLTTASTAGDARAIAAI